MQDRGPLRLVADGPLANHTSDMEQESGVGVLDGLAVRSSPQVEFGGSCDGMIEACATYICTCYCTSYGE